MSTGSRFILEFAVESVACPATLVCDDALRDVRLSVALGEYPVMHIAPLQLSHSTDADQQRSINFGGSGKLFELVATKPAFSKLNLTLLLVKELAVLEDFLILTMTAPISLQELLMSLPSTASESDAVPFVRRSFQFIDDTGSCYIWLRISSKSYTRTRMLSRPRTVPTQPSPQITIEKDEPSPVVHAKSRPMKQHADSPLQYGSLRGRGIHIR